MRIIILVVIFLNSTTCFAFNWDKCKKVFKGSNNLITASTAATGSSSSYISSTGDCAMIGMAAHDKKAFIAHNLDHIQSDSARGQGEYLSAYATLSGCSKAGSKKLGNTLQSNFSRVFGDKVEYSAKQAYERIESLISDDPKLRISCKPKA